MRDSAFLLHALSYGQEVLSLKNNNPENDNNVNTKLYWYSTFLYKRLSVFHTAKKHKI